MQGLTDPPAAAGQLHVTTHNVRGASTHLHSILHALDAWWLPQPDIVIYTETKVLSSAGGLIQTIKKGMAERGYLTVQSNVPRALRPTAPRQYGMAEVIIALGPRMGGRAAVEPLG